ncbi:MAG TPA: WD40 repeat domain-containing protein, partial [Jiangellaceae bacterium]
VALVRAADEPMRFMVLDADTGSVLLDQSFDAARVTGAVSPDGSKVVLAAREIWGSSFVAVDLSDLSMSDPITVKERVTAISISPDGSRVVTGHATGDVALRNPESFTADVQSPQQLDDSISAVGFTPDSKAVLAGRQSGVVDVFDATTLEPRFGPLEGHRRVVTGVAANDRIVVTASADGSVRMWDVASGTALGGPIPTGGVTGPSIAIRDDGQRALVQSDRGLLELILAEDEWIRLACSISGRELTEDERASHGLAMSANACGGLG